MMYNMRRTMSQALVNRNRTRNSLRQVMSPRTVLLRMAEDQERAARIKGLKDSRPDLTWAKIAEGVGVKERSAIEWASSGGISEPNAKKLAALFGVPFDYIWRGPESDTPDPFAHVNGGRSQLDRIEAKLDQLLRENIALNARLEDEGARLVSFVRRTLGTPERPPEDEEQGRSQGQAS